MKVRSLAALLAACAPSPGGTTAEDSTSGATLISTGASTQVASVSSGDPTAASSSGPTTGASSTGGGGLACNGHPQLCGRRYDEVVFPGTHNSFSARDAGFSQLNANHRRVLATQLAEGVRVLLLDVTTDAGETVLCHGPCSLGRIPHADALADIKAFLDAAPREILTIIYQDDVSPAELAADLADAGLEPYLYTHAGAFPTLGEMIDAGTRLVVTLENGGPPPAWAHHVWDLAWDTPYTFHSQDEFSCALGRGAQDNPLFLINHWISNQLDLPSEPDAAVVNVYDVLHARALQCMQETGDLPNFIAVDFYEKGDLFAVVAALNGV